MAKVCTEMKEALVADGRWRDFVRYRDERIAEGVSRGDAFNMAIAEVCPDWADKAAGGRKGGKPGALRQAAQAEEAVGRVVEAAKAMDVLEAKRKERQGVKLVDASVFASKEKVGAAEELLWVVKNLNMNVGAADAPGELAWNFLMMCRESADFRTKFMLTIASDVVKRRTDEEAADKRKFDGQAEYDILANLEEAVG